MKKIGILVVAYNAASTLAAVLDRIPPDFRSRISEVLVSDDSSNDSTHLIALGYQQLADDLHITAVRQHENLGYGGNQKVGYRWAIEAGLDIVVLLHGDGQYAPEMLPDIVAPIEAGEAEVVFGSRMLDKGGARGGGMPLYKFVGNRILTKWENTMAGTELSEWHSGYRAYAVDALAEIPFASNSDDFDFDTEIILQMIEADKRIVEVPIPTYYGDEISRVNGLKYAKDVAGHTMQYRLHKMGFGSGERAFASDAYEMKMDGDTSHTRLLTWLRRRRPSRVLDLGCSDGAFAEAATALGHTVVGVDLVEHEGVRDRVEDFVIGDLADGIPSEVGKDFDVIVAADVFEHVRHPGRLLEECHGVLADGGSIITSVPNFGHWYARFRVTAGIFDYDRRGILDVDHVRFFTRRSFERLVDAAGFTVARAEATGLPIEVADRGAGEHADTPSKGRSIVSKVDRALVGIRPTLFAYQFLYELEPARP
jgi:glycosyltransferase involved in cell wall biosynthesis